MELAFVKFNYMPPKFSSIDSCWEAMLKSGTAKLSDRPGLLCSYLVGWKKFLIFNSSMRIWLLLIILVHSFNTFFFFPGYGLANYLPDAYYLVKLEEI